MLERMLLRFPMRSRVPLVLLHSPRDCAAAGVRAPFALALALASSVKTRSYATPGRPKSVVGEPSRPVKRAVKKAADEPADGTAAPKGQVAAKKRIPTKTRALSPEKAEQQKDAAEKKDARAAALKAKVALRKSSDRKKAKLNDLKAAALPDAPRRLVFRSAYQLYWAERVSAAVGTDATTAARTKEAAMKWKELSAADLEHYNHLQRTHKEASEAEYQRWIESHTPEQIRLANLARAQLRREFPSQKAKWAKLQDQRRPKHAQTAFLIFSCNRQASGDFTHIKVPDRTKLISQEWKALSESERSKYDKLFKQDYERWAEEYARAYGRAPDAKKAAAAATA